MAGAPLFKFKQGDHCCVFYEDENALLDLLVPFFAEGLRKGERCFTAQTVSVADKLLAGLHNNGIKIREDVARGAFNIVTLDSFYGPDAGEFSPKGLMGELEAFVRESVRMGFPGSRMAGEMQFVIHNGVECNHLLEYERLVDEAFPYQPVLGICQYNTALFDEEMLEKVVAVHRQSMHNIHPRSQHSSMAIRRGRYILDIVADRVHPRTSFYYVAQEHGKKDILGWGVEPSFDDAMYQGETLLTSLQGAAD